MPDQINLKDEKYLQSYASQIRSLPLGELYEILGVVRKDPSPERVNIVSERIHELENAPKPEKVEKSEKKSRERSSSRKNSAEKTSKGHSGSHYGGHHRHHHEHSPKATPLTWAALSFSAIVLVLSRAIDTITHEGSPLDIPAQVLVYSMELTPFLCFGVGYLVARSFHRTKKRAVLLGVTSFLMVKAVLGFFFESYLGFAFRFYDEQALPISGIVFLVSLLFTVGMCLRETRKANDIEGLLPLAIALAAEAAASMHLI